MFFLSKGIKVHEVPPIIQVSHRGTVHTLAGEAGILWLSGQYGPHFLAARTKCFDALVELGLVETSDETTELARYRLLTNCVICLTHGPLRRPKTVQEQTILKWLRYAGLRLTVAELICLAEKQIMPVTSLLGKGNRQALVEAIYTIDNITDMVLECQMEHAERRDATLDAIFRLLGENRIYLV